MGLVCSATDSAQATGSAVKTQFSITMPSGVTGRRAVVNVDFAGIDPTGPKILCELAVGVLDSPGTGTDHTPTVVNRNDNGTVRATVKKNYSGEPTFTSQSVLEKRYAHPQDKCTFILRPDIKPGETLVLRTTPVSSSGPVCAPTLIWEEA